MQSVDVWLGTSGLMPFGTTVGAMWSVGVWLGVQGLVSMFSSRAKDEGVRVGVMERIGFWLGTAMLPSRAARDEEVTVGAM